MPHTQQEPKPAADDRSSRTVPEIEEDRDQLRRRLKAEELETRIDRSPSGRAFLERIRAL